MSQSGKLRSHCSLNNLMERSWGVGLPDAWPGSRAHGAIWVVCMLAPWLPSGWLPWPPFHLACLGAPAEKEPVFLGRPQVLAVPAIGHTGFHTHPIQPPGFGCLDPDLTPSWKDDDKLPKTPSSEMTRPRSLVNTSEGVSSLLVFSSDSIFCHYHLISSSLFQYCKLS